MVGVRSASRSGDEALSYQCHDYDVFVSFRGQDTRTVFTAHLFDALDQVGVKTFGDGARFRPDKGVLEAIRSSRTAIVVFSQDYAISVRCLYEVAEIVERVKSEGLTFLSIFYDVDPSDVGEQTGPYAKPFVQHELNGKDEVKRWRVALKEASSFSGYRVTPDKVELVLKHIVRHVLSALNYTWFQSPANLVGMQSHLAAVDSLLNPESKDVQMVAICGMEGIGKTTIAKTFFQEKNRFFKCCAILENVTDTCHESPRKGLLKLQRRLLSQISKEEVKIWDVDQGADMIKHSCRDLNTLLVIDDVNDAVQLEKLAGACDWFGPTSIIIVTTRDRNVLHNSEEMKLYEVPPLTAVDAYQLFTRTAFQNNDPREAYDGIVNTSLEFALGLPLAISVLGSLFRRTPKNEWESTLEVLKSCSPHKIVDSCINLAKLLSSPQKVQSSVFRTCSNLVGLPLLPISYVVRRRNLVDFRRLSPSLQNLYIVECPELVELPPLPPSLESLDVSWCSKLVKLPQLPPSLHNLRATVCSELAELPPLPPSLQGLDVSWCSKLLKLPQLPPSLQNLHVKECSKLAELPPLPPTLQSLDVSSCSKLAKLPQLPLSLQNLPVTKCSELVELPPLPPTLKSLEVSWCNKLAKLPHLPSRLKNLHVIGCSELVELPLLPPSLESLDVSWCTKLIKLLQLPPSLQNLRATVCSELVELPPLPPSLQGLDVSRCSKLVKLPLLPPSLQNLCATKCSELVELPPLPRSLQGLDVSWCSKLVKLPQLPPGLQSLCATECNELAELPPLPPSLQNWPVTGCSELVDLSPLPPTLKSLEVSECSKLAKLPQLPPSLQNLHAIDCIELAELPPLPPSLESLDVSGCSKLVKLLQLPSSLQNLRVVGCSELAELPPLPPSLESLDVSGCRKLAKLPQLPPSLQNLHVIGCIELAELPPLPPSLKSLDVTWCHKLVMLPQLPPSLQNLCAPKCSELAELPPLPPSLESLDVSKCSKLVKLPQLPPCLQNLRVIGCSELAELPPLPPSLPSLDVSQCNKLVKLPQLPPSLQYLCATECSELAELPTLPASLEDLDVFQCSNLVELPLLPPSLESLDVSWCSKLVKLPQLPPSLRNLHATGCSELAELPPLPSGLESLNVSRCSKLVKLKQMPPSLQSLDLSGCSEFVKLPQLPPSLQNLRVTKCSNLAKLSPDILDVNERHEFSEHLSSPPSIQRLAVDRSISVVEPQLSMPRLGLESLSTLEHPLPFRCLVRMETLNELYLDKTAIDELPASIENLVGLKKLYLRKCKNIKTLPNSIYRLQSLQRISLGGCSKLVGFPKYTDGSGSSPSTQKPLSFAKWTYINLQGCHLREINFINDLDCISTLKNFDLSGNELVTIPECISKLTALQQLNLENCKQLREILGLPPNLKYLSAKGCKSLEWYMPLSKMLKSHPVNSPWFRQIDFSGCNKLSEGNSSLANFFSIEDLIMDSQIKILHPGNEIPKWFRYKSLEGSISFSIDSESYQNIAGLAFCAVIGLEGWEQSEVSFSCQIEVFTNNQRTYSYMDIFKSFGSEHMWFMYVPCRMIWGWDTHMQNQCNDFRVLLKSSKDTLKCCGVHLAFDKDMQAR